MEIHFANDALHVRIRDNGPGRQAKSTPRHGLREREAAVGGDFHAARLLPEAS